MLALKSNRTLAQTVVRAFLGPFALIQRDEACNRADTHAFQVLIHMHSIAEYGEAACFGSTHTGEKSLCPQINIDPPQITRKNLFEKANSKGEAARGGLGIDDEIISRWKNERVSFVFSCSPTE